MDIKHSFFSGMELGDSESTTLTQYYLVQVCVCTLFFLLFNYVCVHFFPGKPTAVADVRFYGPGV